MDLPYNTVLVENPARKFHFSSWQNWLPFGLLAKGSGIDSVPTGL
jgi:hypothetical protein